MSGITDSLKSVNHLWKPLVVGSGIILLAASIAIPNLLRTRSATGVPALEHMYASTRLENMALPDAAPVSLGAVVAELKSAAWPAEKSATADRKIVRTG